MENPPFRLGFGLEPKNYIERYEEKQEIISDFMRESPVSNSYLVIGCRGSGKTVFISNLSSSLEKENGWLCVDPAVKSDILSNLAHRILEKGKLKKLFLSGEFSISFQGLGVSVRGEGPALSAVGAIEKMLAYLKKKKTKLLITIDEVDNSSEMKDFLSAYQYFLRQGYEVRLLMSGLYENVSSLREEKSLTFLYRCPTVQLSPLDIGSISARYEELLGVDPSLALKLAKQTKGFAFAYQALGYLFYQNDRKEITPIFLAEYDALLARYVYRKVYADFTGSERKIISCFTDMKPMKVSDISEKTGFSAKYLGVYRERLMGKGILLSPKKGYLALALPRFDAFIARQDEDLIV